MRNFIIPKKPYDTQMFAKSKLELNENTISCFVGCNGSGKTTIIDFIIDKLRHDGAREIKVSAYQNLENAFKESFGDVKDDHKDTSKDLYVIFNKNSEFASSQEDYFKMKATVCFSSTGEGLMHRFGRVLAVLGSEIRNENNKGKSLFIFFDDCDAGTSIDMINDITSVFNLITTDCIKNNITYYIVVTANSYELCKDVDCISVHDFKHLKFDSYESYRKFVLRSRKKKNKRYGNEE